jgi:hypothetical protein
MKYSNDNLSLLKQIWPLEKDDDITEILKYVTWAREGYPIQQGIPKSHLPRSYQGLLDNAV